MHTHSLMCMTENCCLQDLHAYNQDPKKRSTYEKIKFHISPHIEQQRLARRQQDSFEREQRVRMSEEKKWEEEYFRTDVHQKRVERYHEFANNLEEKRMAEASRRIEVVNKQNARYTDFAERLRSKEAEDDAIRLQKLQRHKVRYDRFIEQESKFRERF
mmetsp:Transcript_18300/g.60137  ORF Transcript_18300/g.60137 Transcript_18300/m.60137 type:complete len:159 (-) Transcript_18300:199-675(-)